MQLIKLGTAVLNQTPLAWDENRANILAAIEAARAAEVSILCLPELCLTGYGCEDAFQSPAVQRMAWRVLEEVLPHTRGLVVSVGLPVPFSGALYNAAALVVDGRVAGLVAKQFLAGEGIHYEPRWFRPWPDGRRVQLEVEQAVYPLGDLFFDVGGVRIGFEICEDAWVANRPGSQLALRGVDIILNPSASHFAFGKRDIRQRFVLEGSRAFGVSYVYSNLVGNEAGRAIYDGGAMIATRGRLAALGPRFVFADFHLTTALVDLDATRLARARSGSFSPEFDHDASDCVPVGFRYPEHEPRSDVATQAAWETGPFVKEEEFTRAVALGLFDYLRKSRSRGFVVSISGGADSAAVSCLAAAVVHLGLNELGPESLLAKLAYMPELAQAQDARALVGRLLTCVYQSTRNSTATTRDAACAVADAIGARFLEFDVDPLVRQYVEMVAAAVGRPLDWQQDDLALQNIQARARSPGVWLLANLYGALLLSTSNRSEAAVGYATMDGDTSGGLSPIAGIDKAFLRHWLRWMEQQGPEGWQPLPALAAVNRQPPTAELRPPTSGQTDEADLMPYDLLDAIERAAIRDKRSPLEVYKLMRAEFPHHAPEQLLVWVERFFRLWCRNQWKRERYAPSFHVDDENLDPKTWCRFPILSGGFQRELRELRQHVQGKAGGEERR